MLALTVELVFYAMFYKKTIRWEFTASLMVSETDLCSMTNRFTGNITCSLSRLCSFYTKNRRTRIKRQTDNLTLQMSLLVNFLSLVC